MSIFSSRSARHQASGNKRQRKRDRAIRRRRIASAIEPLEDRHLLAFDINLFADINQLGVSAAIDSMVEFNGDAYFVADDGQTGGELWKSDGTLAGTEQVIDLLPGPDGSQPAGLTVVGSELFFVAVDEGDEFDLWKTDGTTAGTVLVFDADTNGVYYPTELTASGGKLFFTAYEYATGYELWVSDGTGAGTMLVKDINPDQTILGGPRDLTDVGGTLFFSSYDNGYDNRELWKSDGTAAGTLMVKDLAIDMSDPMNPDPTISSYPYNLTNVGGMLFFTAEDPANGIELFKSDGSVAGTMQVADIDPLGSSYPEDLTDFGGLVFFSADDGVTGRQLFKSDGTPGGTLMVANTAGGTDASNPDNLEVVGSELFFAAEGSVPATTITAQIPTLLADNSILTGAAFAGVVTQLTTGPDRGLLGTFGGNGVFTAKPQTSTNDGPGWVGNGAKIGDPGVVLDTLAVNDFYLADIDSGDLANDTWEWTVSDAAGLTNINFSGFASGNQFDEPQEGIVFELFLNNSTTRTSVLEVNGDDLDNWFAGRTANNISITNPGGASITTATIRMTLGRDGAPTFADGGSEAIVVSAQLTADLSASTTLREPVGRELHKTDGTMGGTVLVKDIGVNSSSNPSRLTASGGRLYFSADEVAGTGRELWTSDGTTAGTMLLVDSRPGNDAYGAPLDGDPQNLTDVGGALFFTTRDNFNDRELWTSDGTVAGTTQVANINVGTQSADVQQMTPVGNLLYFVADDGINGQAVWRADPVSETVTMIADVTPSSSDSVLGLAKFGSGVVFYNDTAGSGGGMFYYNGVTTTEFLSRRPVSLDVEGTMFVENTAINLIYFVVDDPATGEELWNSDGTVGGTMMVQDLNNGNAGSMPRHLTEFNGLMHFTADDGNYGREIFYATSTGEGVMLVQDVNPGTPSSDPEELTVSGIRLFFTADNGTDGRELRTSTGSLLNINPIGSSNPTGLTDIGGTLYFAADNGVDGIEPYKSNGTVAGTVQVANVNPLSASSSPSGFTEVNGTIYFAADDTNNGVLLETFSGITGTQLTDLTSHASYPNSPTATALLGDFEAPTNVNNNYGLRARAYLTAPATGDYTFYIASDDQGSLLLSTDTDPANATQIASVPTFTSPRQYDKFPGQQDSSPISLVEGQIYYIEALMKEGSGGDNLSVAWTGPGLTTPTVIAGQFLHKFGVTPGDLGTGRELWSTDGTPGGTAMVADIQPGAGSSNPELEASTGLRLLMSAIGSGEDDREPWSSGSTSATALQIRDLYQGIDFGSNPQHFVNVAGDFFFVANDGLVGNELFRLTESAPLAPAVEVGAEPGVYPPVAETQRSIVDSFSLVFGEEVSVPASAIQLLNRDTATAVTSLIVNSTVQDGQTIVEVTFGPGPSVITRDPLGTTGLLNSLDDGNYQLTVLAAQVESLQTGLNPDSDLVHGTQAIDLFFRYFGDTDGDRDNDTSDLPRFGQTFRAILGDPNYNEHLDYVGDGDTDVGDLVEFGSRFRTSLPFV